MKATRRNPTWNWAKADAWSEDGLESVYLEYFGLKALPFENTPDPAFFYGGDQYREGLAAILHCITNRKGLMALSGPIGVGKTTVLNAVKRFLPEKTRLISLPHPDADSFELLAFVARNLGLTDIPESHLFLVDLVSKELHRISREGGRTVIMIDEAQLLKDELLEEIRLLSNLETDKEKLIQIILVGQPELMELLSRPDLRAVRQRVALIKILEPLSAEQSLAYIRHRLKVAGGSSDLFTPQALSLIIGYARGIPRVINQLCDGALLNAHGAERSAATRDEVEEIAHDLGLMPGRPAFRQAGPKAEEPPRPAERPAAGARPEAPSQRPTSPLRFGGTPREPAAGFPDQSAAPTFTAASAGPGRPPRAAPVPGPAMADGPSLDQWAEPEPSLGPTPDLYPANEYGSSAKRSWFWPLVLLGLALTFFGAALGFFIQSFYLPPPVQSTSTSTITAPKAYPSQPKAN